MPKQNVLLPRPRQLNWLPDECRLEGERYISLSGSVTADLLRTGRTVQRALAEAGADWELTAGAAGRPYGVIVAEDRALVPHREGYRLSIRPDEVRLIGADAAGVFYGAQTLKQIARQAAGTGALPCVDILDWPDFANRGVTSRHQPQPGPHHGLPLQPRRHAVGVEDQPVQPAHGAHVRLPGASAGVGEGLADDR